MNVRLDSSIYTSNVDREALLKKTASELASYADALSSVAWKSDSPALLEIEYLVASAATTYLTYYYAKENMR